MTKLLALLMLCSLVSLPASASSRVVRSPARDDHPSQRFERLLERLESPLGLDENPSPSDLAERLIENDSRKALYTLQSLSRLYEKSDLSGAENVLKDIKAFEDALGAWAAQIEFVEFSEKVNAPEAALTLQRALREDAAKALRKECKAFFLEKKSGYEKLKKHVRALQFASPKKDEETLLKVVAQEIKKVIRTDFDMTQLQTGVHELRRQVRWFSYYVDALDGSVNLTGEDGLNFDSGRKARVFVPAMAYQELQAFIKSIGKMKDAGEYVEALADALHKSKTASDAHKAHVMALELAERAQVEIEKDPLKVSNALYAEFSKQRVLERWLKAFEEAGY